MFSLRRVAFRALSTPLSIQSRSITTLTPSISHLNRQSLIVPFQRRFASDDVTQSEPEADGATEAEHGKTSSAVSSKVSEKVSTAADSIASSARSAQETISGAASAVSGFSNPSSSPAYSRREPTAVSHTVYVGNLFFDVTEDMLKTELEKAGTVNSVKIIVDGRGLSKGFGYVEYTSTEEAGRAIEMFNQQTFEGRRISVQYSVPRAGNRPNSSSTTNGQATKTLFIGNMAFEMSDQDLNDLFRTIDNVIDVRVAIDRRTGQPRGFAHADFVDVQSAEKAMQLLKDKEVMGRRLRIDFSQSAGRSATPRS